METPTKEKRFEQGTFKQGIEGPLTDPSLQQTISNALIMFNASIIT